MASSNKWHMIEQSEASKHTLNLIRQIVDGLKLTPNPNKKMIALSIGDPTVYGNLPPSQTTVEAILKSACSGKHNGYAPAIGFESARQAVAKSHQLEGYNITAEDVVLTSGCSHALEMCMAVLANQGQNILIPKPGFSIYQTVATSLGITCRNYMLLPAKNWEVDLDHLQSLIDSETVAIIVINPSNPCGSVYSREHLMEIIKLSEKYKIPIIADEIYEYLVFTGYEFFPMASITSTVPIICCGGLAKKHLVPGWRVSKGLRALATRINGANTIVQGALPDIIENTPSEFTSNLLDLLESNAKIAYESLTETPGLIPSLPMGAMYMMVGIDIKKFPDFENDTIFAETMVTEQSVFVLPGKCFDYPNYFRIVLTVPAEIMIAACDRMDEFCREHYKHNL